MAQIRIDESVLDGILFLWAEPDKERDLPRLWNELIVAQRKMNPVLKAMDWSSMPPDELVTLAAQREAVRTGIEKFLPPAFADLPAITRKSLFCHVLVVIGIGDVAAGPMDHPLDLALMALGLYQAGQHAVQEMARRGKGQIGFYEALVVLGQKYGCPKRKVEHALTVIRKVTWRQLPDKTREEIGGAVAGTESSEAERAFAFKAVKDALNWQAGSLGEKRWGRLPWQELLAVGLRGKLNIAPRAIADRLKEIYRPTATDEDRLMKLRRLEGEDKSPIVVRIDEEDEVDEADPDPAPDAKELLAQLLGRLVEHPRGDRLVRGLRVALSRKPLTELAREWGVTPQTLISWKNECSGFLRDGQT